MSDDFTIESLELDELFTEVNAVDVYQVKSERSQFLHAFEGKMSVAEEQFTIQLALPSLFPLKKPMYFLKNCQEAGFIPHIEPDGFICYSHDEGLLLDRNNPKGIIHESFHRVKRTLEEGVLKLNLEDFLLEFEALWSRQKGIGRVDAIITPEERFKKILVFNDEKRGKSILLDSINKSTVQYMNYLYSSSNVLDEFNKRNGIYIPLRKSSALKPPAFWETWDIRDYRQLINNNITASTKKRLNQYLKRKFIQKGDEEYIVLGIPIPKGQRALIGLKLSDFRADQGKGKNFPFLHPLRKNQAAFEITPLDIKRHDKEYLLNRTQGHNRISDKKVTVVGLGSLGSRICFELRAGVEKFTLIDNDALDIDNVYRHELGIGDVYFKGTERYYHFPKTEAMKRAMKNKFPFIEIEYETSDILDIIHEEPGLLLESDLVIISLGSPTEELYVNEMMRKMYGSPPILFTWLDPLGLGGHALSTKKEATGCFQCLFTQPDTPSRLIANQASFAAPGQNFRKSLAGCQSVFTPYGSIDALETAVMATRLALRVLTGEEKGSPLMSWKGDSTELLSQGYQLSQRYGFSSEVLFDTRYLYKNENCVICQAGETP